MKLSAVVMLLCLMLGACAQKQKIPAATYMGGNHTITEICKELDTAGASHVDTFREWVTDFADHPVRERLSFCSPCRSNHDSVPSHPYICRYLLSCFPDHKKEVYG